MGLEEQKECIDPKYQRDKGVDTYYPQATVCFKDPSAGILYIKNMINKTKYFRLRRYDKVWLLSCSLSDL